MTPLPRSYQLEPAVTRELGGLRREHQAACEVHGPLVVSWTPRLH